MRIDDLVSLCGTRHPLADAGTSEIDQARVARRSSRPQIKSAGQRPYLRRRDHVRSGASGSHGPLRGARRPRRGGVPSHGQRPGGAEPGRPGAHVRRRRLPVGGPVAHTTVWSPAAAAAAKRWSMPPTGRTAPVSDTSPTNATPAGGATPALAEARATATARSAPGRRGGSRPPTAPNSSARDSRTRVARSVTAATMWNRRRVQARRPAGGAAPPPGTTRAWTSTARPRRPAMARAVAHPGSPELSPSGRAGLGLLQPDVRSSRTRPPRPPARTDSCHRPGPGGRTGARPRRSARRRQRARASGARPGPRPW